MPDVAARASATAAGDILQFSGASSVLVLISWTRAICAMRRPYAPLTRTSRLPSLGIADEMTDSIANVPLPCIRTHSYSPSLFGDATPPSASSRWRISRTVSIKARSRDPASCSMASFTVALVVSGPGVKSSLSFVMMSVSLNHRDCVR